MEVSVTRAGKTHIATFIGDLTVRVVAGWIEIDMTPVEFYDNSYGVELLEVEGIIWTCDEETSIVTVSIDPHKQYGFMVEIY